MPKATLEFDLTDPDERDLFEITIRASMYKFALEEVVQRLFRPARKYGYPEGSKIGELYSKIGESSGLAEVLVEALEEQFWEIMQEHGVKLD